MIGAKSKEQAVTLSKSIITSNLTKAAIFGHDANWGRILCAMGYSGAVFDPENVDLYFVCDIKKIKNYKYIDVSRKYIIFEVVCSNGKEKK